MCPRHYKTNGGTCVPNGGTCEPNGGTTKEPKFCCFRQCRIDHSIEIRDAGDQGSSLKISINWRERQWCYTDSTGEVDCDTDTCETFDENKQCQTFVDAKPGGLLKGVNMSSHAEEAENREVDKCKDDSQPSVDSSDAETDCPTVNKEGHFLIVAEKDGDGNCTGKVITQNCNGYYGGTQWFQDPAGGGQVIGLLDNGWCGEESLTPEEACEYMETAKKINDRAHKEGCDAASKRFYDRNKNAICALVSGGGSGDDNGKYDKDEWEECNTTEGGGGTCDTGSGGSAGASHPGGDIPGPGQGYFGNRPTLKELFGVDCCECDK